MCTQVWAQKLVGGVMVEGGTKAVLPYVNIGILNKNVGTVSSDKGVFSLNIPEQNAGDTLTFSMIGYSDVSIPVAAMNVGKAIVLTPVNYGLKEATISTKKLVEKKYGLSKYHPLIHFLDGSTDHDDVFEIAQLVNLGAGRARVTSLNLFINEGREDSGVFRINFYSYDGHRPGKQLLEHNIVQTHAIKEGWLKFDLSDAGIYLKGEVVAAIEFIPTARKHNKVVYEIKPGGRIKSFVRAHSQGTWQVPPHQYRMYVTALTTADNSMIEEDEQELRPTFRLYSEAVKDSFSIFVALPKGYNKHKRAAYPVVYVLDANVYFGFLRDTICKLAGIQPVLIGIGYKDLLELDSLRDRDYTYPAALATDSFKVSGGADRFYNFIENELMPYTESLYHIDKNNRSLMGHSLGGYFTLYTLYHDLMTDSKGFKNYVAASPSIDYHNEYLAGQFRSIPEANRATRRVYITHGTVEEDDATTSDKYSEQVRAFVKQLSGTKPRGIQCTLQVYPGAAHMETALPSFYEGLQMILGSK